jgi:predicted ATP-grasp superfamily ATP-dependent carboligase
MSKGKGSSKKQTPERLPIFQPQPSMICTKSLYFYIFDFTQIVEFFVFTVQVASKVDEYAKNAAHALAAIDKGLMIAQEREGTIEELERKRDAALAEIETKGAAKQLAEYSVMIFDT